ncbi:MAG: flagellar motor protein MotD [Thermodesulfovibrio sp.]|nr:flagellar motor protein MotD [Thermodesulfovibrio sp.]
MRKRRAHAEEENPDRWVVSYADFITLLFAFFTAMYAISRVDTGKLQMFAGSMRTAFRSASVQTTPVIEGIVPIPQDTLRLEKEASRVIAALKMPEDISVRQEARGVIISIGDNALFDVGQATVKESSVSALSAIASVITRVPNQVVVEGHTDNVPVGVSGKSARPQYTTNWELSTARATSVLQYFLGNYSLPAERFSASGYAEFRPVASNATPQGRTRNRRVDIVLLSAAVPESAQKGEVRKPQFQKPGIQQPNLQQPNLQQMDRQVR